MPRSDFRERPDTRNEEGCGGGEEAALYRLHSGERGCPSASLDSARRERRYFPGHLSHGPGTLGGFRGQDAAHCHSERGKTPCSVIFLGELSNKKNACFP